MKKNSIKKGFTLVELLAVLVVLAILAVITIPVVTKVINKTKTSSYELSVSAYGKTAENGIMAWAVEHQTGTYEVVNGWNDFVSVYGSFIETKGEEVTCQDAKVTKEGKLSLYECSTIDSAKEHKYYNYIKGKAQLITSVSSTREYKVGDQITYKDIQWRVIENNDERQDSVKLLMESVLTKEEVNYYGNGYLYDGTSDGEVEYYKTDFCNETDQSGCTNDYALSKVKQIIDLWSEEKLDYNDLVEDENGYKVRLITAKEYRNIDNNPNNNPWRCLNSYWTMSEYNGSSLMLYAYSPNTGYKGYNIYEKFKIRPVIELSKSAITKVEN